MTTRFLPNLQETAVAFTLLFMSLPARTVCAAPPTILYSPRDQAVTLYQQGAFDVIASGTPPLSYQWHRDGMPLSDATNDQIVIAQANFSVAGRYWVVVSNSEGSVTSTDAALNVEAPKAGDLDCSFACGGLLGPGGGPEAVTSIAVENDGKVLLGGRFSAVAGASRGNIARLIANGALDMSFLNGLPGVEVGYVDSYRLPVQCMVVQTDGKVLIGGRFTTVNEVSRTNIARLNSDGTLDTGFVRGLGVQGPLGIEEVIASAVQNDGKVLLSAKWLWARDAGSLVARLNSDGHLDDSFPRLEFSYSGDFFVQGVCSIALQNDGKALIGGSFHSIQNQERNCIARLNSDGTIDTSFLCGLAGVEGDWLLGQPKVASVVVQPNGKVLIGGLFSAVNGVGRNSLARLNADGTLDMSFLDGLSGVNGEVLAIKVNSAGKVLIGGSFSAVNGVSRTNLALLNADGTLDNAFLDGLSGPNATVRSLAFDKHENVLVGGDFFTVNGVPAAGIARLWASADIPPRIQSLTRSDAGVNLTWEALPHRTYRVQYANDPIADNWTDLPGDLLGLPGGTASKIDKVGPRQRFYRVLLLP